MEEEQERIGKDGTGRERPGTFFLREETVGSKYGIRIKRYVFTMPRPSPKRKTYYDESVIVSLLESDERLREESRKWVESQMEMKRIREEKRKKKKEKAERERKVGNFLSSFSPEEYQKAAAGLDRSFHFHIGPTNSGKTHDALEALMKAESGMYLGPLRLLALEVFDRLNGAGVPCNLLTGEEEETVPGARITASTIELCDYSKRYDVVVIDEAQMIADRSRGSHWTKAILTVNAREIHVCMAPMAKDLLLKLVGAIPAPYAVHEHERLVPLVFSGYWRKLSDIEEGDAVIAFSRNQVLNIAAHLESVHMPASVIYGSLPPAARREEVRRFASKETKVAVATDAIGMGISLPIKRILFSQTSKFDGERTRSLKPWEIQQIAGRAGRFGMYDLGEVLTLEDSHLVRTGREVVRTGMEAEISQITRLVLPFPREALGSGFSLMELLTGWNMLGQGDLFVREDLSEARTLLSHLGGRFDKDVRDRPDLVYDLITCPVDTKNSELVYYWKTCAAGILRDRGIPYPNYSLETLESCERQYHALDIYYQLSRRIGLRASVQEEKEKVCARIHEFLKTDKQLYLRRCSYCGKKLPWDFPFGMCEKCYAIGWGDFQGGW